MDTKNKPGAAGGPRTGANFQRFSANKHSPSGRRPPPYSKQLRGDRQKTLAVLVGSAAWDRAKSPSWFPGRKIVLPPGEHPAAFDWSCVAGYPDAVIVTVGDPESLESITALAGELLRYVGQVLHIGPGPVIRFEPRRVAA